MPSKIRTLPARVAPMPLRVNMAQPGQANYGQGRGGRPWRRKRDRVLARDHFLCQCEECKEQGRTLPAHEVDHVVPLAEGGTDDDGNLRAINRDCHKRKTQREAQRGQRAPGGVGRKSRG